MPPSRRSRDGLAWRTGVRLLGPLPHQALAQLYSAADISVLASSREGWANVLLESMACGTPVVASPIPGNDEVVRAPEAGRHRHRPLSRRNRRLAARYRGFSPGPGGDAGLRGTIFLGRDQRRAAPGFSPVRAASQGGGLKPTLLFEDEAKRSFSLACARSGLCRAVDG